jgi:hypothetical protein
VNHKALSYKETLRRQKDWATHYCPIDTSFAASSNVISHKSHQFWSFKSWIILETAIQTINSFINDKKEKDKKMHALT